MLDILDTTKSAYTDGSTHKTLTISFPNVNITVTNSDIVGESLTIVESIETEDRLTFKGCIASQMKFKVADIVRDLRGEYVEASIQAGETEVIPLFKGYIDAQDNQTHEDVLTEFTAYDPLRKFAYANMQSWMEGLTYPITVKNFRDSLFRKLRAAQETRTLCNDSLAISENILGFVNNPTALEILRWICEVNGVFGQMGRDGVFYYRRLDTIIKGTYPWEHTYPSKTTYPSGENADAFVLQNLYSKIEYQPYEVEKISKVAIFDSAGLDEGKYGDSDKNVFSVSDNPVAFCVNMMTAAKNLYGVIGNLPYIPVVNLDCVGMPWMECGDIFLSTTRKNVVRSYILNRTLKGIQALFDNYTSDSDRYQPEYKSTAYTYINANRQSVIDIQADIVQMNEVIATKATISDLEATNATVSSLSAREANFETATANNFTADRARLTQAEADIVSANKVIATKATISDLEATNATVSSLSAREANFETATANDFAATNAAIDALSVQSINADRITAGTLSVDRLAANSIDVAKLTGSISNGGWGVNLGTGSFSVGNLDASHITSGTISADRIDSALLRTSNLSAAIAQLTSVTAARLIVNSAADIKGGATIGHSCTILDKAVSWKEITVGSTKYTVLTG